MTKNSSGARIRRTLTLFFVFLGGTSSFSVSQATDWQNIVQPIGEANNPFLVEPVVLNEPYGVGKGPWDPETMVTNIKTTVPQFFVRFYNPTAALNSSKQEGSWVMRASSVRGLNAQQVQDLFALPNTPTMMTLGISTPGASLYTGIAAPISGWGDGGGEQFKFYSGPYTTFFNAQAVPDCVLCYQTMASSANTFVLGSYLVAHQPAPYSDMESVYNGLDVLANPTSIDQLNSALTRMSPACFDNLVTSGAQAVAIQNRAIAHRLDLVAQKASTPGAWAKAVGTNQHYQTAGFDGEVNGMLIGTDRELFDNTIAGLSLAWLHGDIRWDNDYGKASTDSWRVAAYSAASFKQAFLQAAVSAGSASGNTARNIRIDTFYQPSPFAPTISPLSALARVAQADINGWDTDLDLRAGGSLHRGPYDLLASISLGYLYQARSAFNESGADSLDLRVAETHNQTIHSQADLRVGREFSDNEDKKITPYILLGWVYENRIDRQATTASLNGWGDSFTTYSPSLGEDSLLGGAGVLLKSGESLFLHADYTYIGHGGYENQAFATGLSWKF